MKVLTMRRKRVSVLKILQPVEKLHKCTFCAVGSFFIGGSMKSFKMQKKREMRARNK